MNKSLDYIIVGQGVAGSCFALKLIQENKSFIIIDQKQNQASRVAVGVFNALVLKRFALIWNAEEQLKWMKIYFEKFENLLQQKLIFNIPTYRILNNNNEISTWKDKAKREELKTFMNEEIVHQPISDAIKTPLGYAEVKQTGRIDLQKCLETFRIYLEKNGQCINEKFEYDELKIDENSVQYKNFNAKNIIFCEGYGIKSNPYFNYLPVIGVKGEVLKIKTEKPIPEGIWKAKNFLLPVEKNICLTASTYDRDDLSQQPTEKGKEILTELLEEIYDGDYEILEHTAGIRPTVIDRRPLLGHHPNHKNAFILNGMGTRGTLLAPQMTEFLFDFIENGIEITKEANIRRFDPILENQINPS